MLQKLMSFHIKGRKMYGLNWKFVSKTSPLIFYFCSCGTFWNHKQLWLSTQLSHNRAGWKPYIKRLLNQKLTGSVLRNIKIKLKELKKPLWENSVEDVDYAHHIYWAQFWEVYYVIIYNPAK